MNLRNIYTAVLIFSAVLFSCEEGEEVTGAITRQETTKCKNFNFEFSTAKNANNEILIVINVPTASDTTYSLDINETAEDNTTKDIGVATDNNSFERILNAGTSEFCLTTTSSSCPQGNVSCETIVATQRQINMAKSALVERIKVVSTPDGNYTLDVQNPTTDCEAIDFGISIAKNSEDAFFAQLVAPSPDEIGMEQIRYQWSVTKTSQGGVVEKGDIASGSNATTFNLATGTFEFCLKTTYENCQEGALNCKTLVITGEQFQNINTNVSSIKRINIIPTPSGSLTVEVIRN